MYESQACPGKAMDLPACLGLGFSRLDLHGIHWIKSLGCTLVGRSLEKSELEELMKLIRASGTLCWSQNAFIHLLLRWGRGYKCASIWTRALELLLLDERIIQKRLTCPARSMDGSSQVPQMCPWDQNWWCCCGLHPYPHLHSPSIAQLPLLARMFSGS